MRLFHKALSTWQREYDHPRYVVFPIAEAAISRRLFAASPLPDVARQSRHAMQMRCISLLPLQPCCGMLGLRPVPEADGGITYEVGPDFLEHASREAREQPELPRDA